MANYVKIATTSRTCAGVEEVANVRSVDLVAIDYIDTVLNEVMPQGPDLVVFPEMSDMPTGYSMEAYAGYIAARDESVLTYIGEQARKLGVWIAYSTVRENVPGKLRNTCLLIDRQGNLAATYDKMYPTLGELEVGIEAGEAPTVFECELGRIGFVICFDLNFLELAQLYREEKVNLLLFPALFHGGLLQQMWAFFARSYLVGACGGCGTSVVAPTGEVLRESLGTLSVIAETVNLDYALVHLDYNQEKLVQISERYGDSLRIHPPQQLGVVMLESRSESLTISEVLKEYELETLDDYLQRVKQIKTINE